MIRARLERVDVDWVLSVVGGLGESAVVGVQRDCARRIENKSIDLRASHVLEDTHVVLLINLLYDSFFLLPILR